MQVGPAVVVGVEPGGAEGGAVAAGGATGFGHVLELPVALVPPEAVDGGIGGRVLQPRAFRRAAGADVEVDAAVAVVIGEGNARDGVAGDLEVRPLGVVVEALAGAVAVNAVAQ